jgi:hypothetical protein
MQTVEMHEKIEMCSLKMRELIDRIHTQYGAKVEVNLNCKGVRLADVQQLKERLVLSIMQRDSEEERIIAEVDKWMRLNRYLILDLLDDALCANERG